MLLEHIFLVPELLEPVVLESLGCCDTVIRIVYQQLAYQVGHVCTGVRDQFRNTGAGHGGKVELHVCRILLKIVQ